MTKNPGTATRMCRAFNTAVETVACRDLLAMAAESGGRLEFEIIGGGYGGIYRNAERGDPAAVALRDAINGYLERLFGAPPGSNACFLCGGPFRPPQRIVALVVVVYPSAPAPSCLCCSPVCTECWAGLPEFGDLQHAIMQRYRTWLPTLEVQHIAEPAHA